MKNAPNKHNGETTVESHVSDIIDKTNSSLKRHGANGLKNSVPPSSSNDKKEPSADNAMNTITDATNVENASTDNQLELQIKDLQHQLDSKQKMIEQINADHLRIRADMENYKKRLLKERTDAIDFANQSLISGILEVLDNFDRALHLNGGPQNLADFTNGISLIYQQLQNILQKDWNVVEIDAHNKEFDPMFHEAVVFEEDKNCKAMIVSDVLQKGYSFKGRVIRHARVKVKQPVE